MGSLARVRQGRYAASRYAALSLVTLLTTAPGCASLMRSATSSLAEDLSAAILAHDDPATVRDGAPAFLLLIDGLIRSDPENQALVQAGARLYGTYASSFTDDPARAVRLAKRARSYGERSVCLLNGDLCGALGSPFEDFARELARSREGDVAALYALGTSWATWISLRSGDWNAIADLPKVEAIMERVVQMNESFDDGGAHLYLGVLKNQRPSSLGGKPEEGRKHFERALDLSRDRNLMVKVLLARHYARLVFDRELHDRLLKDVLAADAEEEGFTLSNTLAQDQARGLLETADEYF